MLFVLVSLIYLTLSGMTSFARHENLETVVTSLNTDYYLHTRLGAVIASGVSPYSTTTYFYKISGIIPGIRCQYVGYSTTNAVIINLTSLSAEEVVYVVSPFLFNLALILSIFVACKVLGFNPIESVGFLVLYLFINDPIAIYTPAHAMGETFGNGLGLIGVALFLKIPSNLSKIKNYLCVPFLFFAVILHIANLSFLAILVMFTVLCIFLSIITKKKYSHNYKHLVFLALTGILISPYIIPVFTPIEGIWVSPFTDVGQNVVDPIKNPLRGIFVTQFFVSEGMVKINQSVDIFVGLVNTGNISKSYTVNLTINNVFEDSKTLILPSGSDEQIMFTVIRQDLGIYTCVVDNYGVKRRFEIVSVLPFLDLKPARIGIGPSIIVTPKIAKVNESINISVRVLNRGEQTGTKIVHLEINGIIEQTKNVTLKPDEYKMVIFTVTKSRIGKYILDINKLPGQFEVMYNPPPEKTDILTSPVTRLPMNTLLKSSWSTVSVGNWIRLRSVPEFLITIGYPLSYLYYSTTARSTIGVITNYIGYNITGIDLNSITTSSIIPICLVLAFNIGVPLLFVMTVYDCFKSKERNKFVLVFSAYSLIICLSFLCLITGLFFIPYRFIKYASMFWIIFLVKSNIWSKIKVPASIFFISRSILWILALTSIGGLIV